MKRLKTLSHVKLKRAAVIDIGSSSIKMVIGEAALDGKRWQMIDALKNPILIGKHVFYKESIPQELINEAVIILNKYQQVLREYQVEEVRVIGTTAVREAVNREIFIDTVFRKTGLRIEILTVGDVVYYIGSYLSNKLVEAYDVKRKNFMVVELGSGSMDISLMEAGAILPSLELPVSTLRIKQLIAELEGSEEDVAEAIKEHIANEYDYIKRSFPGVKIEDLILIDDTYAQYLFNLIRPANNNENFFPVTAVQARAVLKRTKNMTTSQLAREYHIPMEQAEYFYPYLLIIALLIEAVPKKSLFLLQTSLAEAIIFRTLLVEKQTKKSDRLFQLVSTAKFICNKYNLDLRHAQQVEMLARSIFIRLKGVLGLQDDELVFLTLASYLHDIGSFIHNRSHNKHSEYVIASLNLFRLTEEEIRMIACIARYHKRAIPNDNHVFFTSLSPDKRILTQKLSAIIKLANALDRSHKSKINKLEIEVKNEKEIVFVAHAEDNLLLEKLDFNLKKEYFEEIIGSKVQLLVKE